MVELPSEFEPDTDESRRVVEYWEKQLQYESKKHKAWRDEKAKKAWKVYWGEDDRPTVYPILANVVEIKHSALYSEQPAPIVRKRFPDAQNFDKKLAQFTERAIKFACDEFPIESAAHSLVDDWQITGLGQWRIRYEADFEEIPNPVALEIGPEMAAAQGVDLVIEQKTSERVWFEAVSWKRFRWQPCTNWEDCKWVGYDEYLTASEIQDRFGVDVRQFGTAKASIPSKENAAEYRVTEIYYKPTRTIYVIGEGISEPLEVADDRLRLKGFFPSPCPVTTGTKSDKFIPTPQYSFFQKGAEKLNRLWTRREKLTEQVKDCGFYDAQLKELGALQNATDGMFVGVKNLIERIKDKTLDGGAIWFKPIENKAKVLTVLDSQLTQEEQLIYRQTGVTDIVQGMAAEVDETYGASRIKNNWAEIRLAPQFDDLKQFLVTSYQMMGEVLLEHFDPERLMQITGIELAPEEMQVLQSDEFRCYAIDIEHELSIGRDQKENAQARGEAMDRVIAIGQAAAQLVPANVWSLDLANAASEFAIRDFPEARALLDALQALPDSQTQFGQMQQQMMQMQQQIAEMTQQLQGAQFELSKRNQAAVEKDAADADKKRAEAEKVRVQTAHEAVPVVSPTVLVDERIATGY